MKQPSEMTDSEFVAWVAGLKVSDEVPREYHIGRRGRFDPTPLVQRLVRLGVMQTPAASDLVMDTIERAITAAKHWIENAD